MNAKEAREKVLSIKEGNNKIVYEAIHMLIDKAVERGEFSIFYYNEINQAVQIDYQALNNKLLEEGFKVDRHFDQREGVTYKISWYED